MASVTEIGSLISRRAEIRGGHPCIAGTGVSVRRIVQWHNMGQIPEEIDADLASEERETEVLERQHRR